MEIMDNNSVLQAIAKHQSRKERIVFTNGCFDILHVGHARYLSLAKALGDVLVVAINTDSSVQRLKGTTRPIVPEQFRAELLLFLKPVDYVCMFDEDTPLNLIKAVKPDFLVKGGDWPIKTIVGADHVLSYGGEVLSLPFVEGFSTTQIVNKILTCGGI